MKFFSASDFDILKQWSSAELAIMCNQKLARESKVVYGLKSTKLDDQFYFSESKDDADTHRALLVCVEEIECKPCEHDVVCHDLAHQSFVCRKCNKDMKPTGWEVVE